MALTKYHAFGLHITDTLIKLVELVPSAPSYAPIAYGEITLPSGIVTEGVINDNERLAGYINQLKQRLSWGKITSDFVVCSIPESRVFLKVITVPHFPKKQLDEAIAWEARSLIPLPVEQAYFQTQVIFSREKDVDVLVSATERKLVDSYLVTLTQAKLTPIAFDLECVAAARAIDDTRVARSTILQIHAGIKTTTLSVFRQGKLFFSNSIPYGIYHLTEELSKELVLPYDKAVEERQRTGISRIQGDLTISAIANGITSTITFFNGQTKDPQEKISELLVTGSFAHLSGFVDKLKNHIQNYTLTIAKPRLQIGRELEGVGCNALATCIGLALRGVYPAQYEDDTNFLPESYIKAIETREIQKKSTRLMAIFAYITFLVGLILGFSYFTLINEVKNLKSDNGLEAQVNATHPAKKLYSWIEEKNSLVSILGEVEKERIPYHLLFRKINQSVPKNVRLVRLEITQSTQNIEIKGVGQSRQSILAFAKKLSEDKAFKEVSLALSSFDEEIEGSFSLTSLFDKSQL